MLEAGSEHTLQQGRKGGRKQGCLVETWGFVPVFLLAGVQS